MTSPRLPKSQQKTRFFTLRLTPAQQRALYARASGAGVSVGEYVRVALNLPKPKN